MLKEEEADRDHAVPASILLNELRQDDDASDLEMGTDERSLRKVYTFADAFCGAGGVSCGANAAGLRVHMAFDHDECKISTYKANFPGCKAKSMAVYDFIAWAKRRGLKVDVLHLSPPCQPFSAANTRPNETLNERNQTPILGCRDLITVLRPRVVTLEETTGVENRHPEWFDALLRQFTELQYSVKWTTLNCADYGVPQTRRRLVLFGAAPGQVLPDFPKPTHSILPRTIADALDQVNRYPYRDETTMYDYQSLLRQPKHSYNPRLTLAHTITTNGGESYHWTGVRQFTIRELLALQTFPITYRFGTQKDGQELGLTEARLQIGNAVPPNLARKIMESVLTALRKTDETR